MDKNPVNSPVEVGSLSHYLQGFSHSRWLFSPDFWPINRIPYQILDTSWGLVKLNDRSQRSHKKNPDPTNTPHRPTKKNKNSSPWEASAANCKPAMILRVVVCSTVNLWIMLNKNTLESLWCYITPRKIEHVPYKRTMFHGSSSSKHHFSGDILVFGRIYFCFGNCYY